MLVSPPFSRMEFGVQVPHVIQGVLHSFRGPNSNHMEASVRLRTSAKKDTFSLAAPGWEMGCLDGKR